jgi:acyl-homoserine-lactone acylase
MRIVFLLLLTGIGVVLQAQSISDPSIHPERITIVRDSFGVPHIFAPTDPEVAFGLAWAHSEDDFETIQTLLLTAKGKLGTYLGKKGATVDYVFGLLNTKATIDTQISSLDPKFLSLVKGYLLGLEAYAKAHPKEVFNMKVFPVTLEEYLAATSFSVAIFCGVDRTLPSILKNAMPELAGFRGEGSNAFAIHSSKSANGENMLVINAHQPIEGATAFYEAHLQSEEGWNILGGLFPGAPLIFHGVNENLAWAHTVNLQDKIDVYQLQTDKQHPGQYKVDDKWLTLTKRKLSFKVKGVPVKVTRTVYTSIYGPTVKSPSGAYFSLRLPALMDAGSLQQWYAMNRANNFTEFKKALEQQHLPMFNIVYADKRDTIFYVSNGRIPVRNPDASLHWNSTIPGNTRSTLWTEIKPFNLLPQYINPKSGYLFNTNHSPFLATNEKENLSPDLFDRNDGYELYHNNRSRRAKDLLDQLDKISYTDIMRIKFDRQLPNPILFPYGYYADSLFLVDENKHATLAPLIRSFKTWDHIASVNSKGALIFSLVYSLVPEIMGGRSQDTLTIAQAIRVYQRIYDYLMKYFNTIDLTLGDVQKLVRGNKSWPQAGVPDVLAAVGSEPWKNGLRRMNGGDAYIAFVRFPKDGSLPLIETVNTFGASSHINSLHFDDQRAMYQSQQAKKMTLDKEEVIKRAERVYHPG